MKIVCAICSDLFVQSDDIFFTRCGHVFHFQCVTKWLERSKSCPQCRERVTQSKIHRLYFTFGNNEVIEDSSATLIERVDSLKFQILLKEKDITHYTSKNVSLEKQNSGLRKEVRKVESEINKKKADIYSLKEQVRHLQEENAECKKLKRDVIRLKNRNEELRDIQVLLHASMEDINAMTEKTNNPATLIKYICVMKKELLSTMKKKNQLCMTVKQLRSELSKVSVEKDTFLEEHKIGELDLGFSESAKMPLEKQIHGLEKFGIAKESTNMDSQEATTSTPNESICLIDDKSLNKFPIKKRCHPDIPSTVNIEEICMSKEICPLTQDDKDLSTEPLHSDSKRLRLPHTHTAIDCVRDSSTCAYTESALKKTNKNCISYPNGRPKETKDSTLKLRQEKHKGTDCEVRVFVDLT